MTTELKIPALPTEALPKETLRRIVLRCSERADALEWKGKRGDDAAFDYLCGAVTALETVGHPHAEFVKRWVLLILRTQGMFAVRGLVAIEEG